MFFHPVCPHCQNVSPLEAGDINVGREWICPSCRKVFTITVPVEKGGQHKSQPADADTRSTSETTPLSSINPLRLKQNKTAITPNQPAPEAKQEARSETKGGTAGKGLRYRWIFLGLIGVILVSCLIYSMFGGKYDRLPTAVPRRKPGRSVPAVAAQPGAASKTPAGPIRDATVYDDFNDPAFDGRFDETRWQFHTDPPHQATQQSGALKIVKEGNVEATRLAARKYRQITLGELTGNKPTFIEARLKLDAAVLQNGLVQMQLFAELPDSKPWYAEYCVQPGGAYCMDGLSWGDPNRFSLSKPAVDDKNTWRVFRITIDPTTMTFTYILDGEEMGTHIPSAAQTLRDCKWTLIVGVWGCEGQPVTGYIDYVRVGPLGGNEYPKPPAPPPTAAGATP